MIEKKFFFQPKVKEMGRVLALFILGLSCDMQAQSDSLPSGASSVADVKFCGQWTMTEAFFQAHPEERLRAEQDDARLELETAQFSDVSRDELIVIPVVFHVIHFNGPENISEDQIHSAIEVLNRDFRKLNTDIIDVVGDFEDITADSEIEFRLAQRDPNGDCHMGINRIVNALTYDGGGEVKELIQWPRNNYLNIWVVEYAAGAAGYSLYPSSVNGNQSAGNDGIVIRSNYTGNIGTSNNFRSRTLTHEAGHWMNLRHLWGNSNDPGDAENCEMDDNVTDTPLTSGWTSCNLDGETCGSLDNVQNYMEYSYCGRMFTEGQSTRMRAAMNSFTAQRNQLWTPENLENTGVNEEPILCEARFNVSRQTICAGDSVQFFDNSYHGASAWSWNFGNGNVGTDENPWNQYNSPGFYDVELTIGNGVDEVSSTENNYIQVLPAGALPLPFADDFEEIELSENWFMVDVGNDGDGWEITSAASFTGDRSIRIHNWSNNVEFNTDQLVSSSMNMSDAEEIHISYKWAYCFKGTDEDEDDTDDRLKIYASPDCGENWSLRQMHRGYTDLPSAAPHAFAFTPSGPEEWNSHTLVLPYEQFFTDNFRMKFEFESRLGNNIYLDDVNIEAYTAADLLEREAYQSIPLVIYPNPTQGTAWLEFQTWTAHEARVQLFDMTGRLLYSVDKGVLSPGAQRMALPTESWARGTYVIALELDGVRSTERLMVN